MEWALSLEGANVGEQDGKYLVFSLEENYYGIQILQILDINGLMEITPTPKTPEFIKGVMNLRGKIIPVMDLRLKLGMPPREYDKQTCIIIVNISVETTNKQMGVLVDTVSEVFDIPLSEIEAPPNYGIESDEGFLNGIGKVKGKLVMLLNMEKVLHSEEIIKLLDKNTEIGV